MKSIYSFVVTPKGERYNNKKKVGDSELICKQRGCCYINTYGWSNRYKSWRYSYSTS